MKGAVLILGAMAAGLPALLPGARAAVAASPGGNGVVISGDRDRKPGGVFTPNPTRDQRPGGPA